MIFYFSGTGNSLYVAGKLFENDGTEPSPFRRLINSYDHIALLMSIFNISMGFGSLF